MCEIQKKNIGHTEDIIVLLHLSSILVQLNGIMISNCLLISNFNNREGIRIRIRISSVKIIFDHYTILAAPRSSQFLVNGEGEGEGM